MKIRVKILNENARIPRVSEGNACFDFYASERVFIYPGQKGVPVHTGLAFEIPPGYHMKLFMRSSYGKKTPLRLSNEVGIVDSSYRGEIIGIFDNIARFSLKDGECVIDKGDRFLQGMIEKNIPVEFEESDTLSETERGAGGFGSTGK